MLVSHVQHGIWNVVFLSFNGEPAAAWIVSRMSGIYTDQDPIEGYTYIEGATE